MSQNHLIRSLVLEIHVPKREGAWEMQDLLMSRYKELILDELQRLFDQYIQPEEQVTVEKLELDLGHFVDSKFEQNLPEQVRQTMEETLIQLLYEARQQPGKTSSISIQIGDQQAIHVETKLQSTQRSHVDLLIHFLHYGSLPWNGGKQIQIGSVLQEVIQKEPDFFRSKLALAIQRATVRERIVRQFTSAQQRDFHQLLSAMPASVYERFEQAVQQFLKLFEGSFSIPNFNSLLLQTWAATASGEKEISVATRFQHFILQLQREVPQIREQLRIALAVAQTSSKTDTQSKQQTAALFALLHSNLHANDFELVQEILIHGKVNEASVLSEQKSFVQKLNKLRAIGLLSTDDWQTIYQETKSSITIPAHISQAIQELEEPARFKKKQDEVKREYVLELEALKKLSTKEKLALAKKATLTKAEKAVLEEAEKVALKQAEKEEAKLTEKEKLARAKKATLEKAKQEKLERSEKEKLADAKKTTQAQAEKEKQGKSKRSEKEKLADVKKATLAQAEKEKLERAAKKQIEEQEAEQKTKKRSYEEEFVPPEAFEGLYIDNGGLILATPFLSTLFQKLGYTENRQFKDEDAQDRAALLLHQMVWGETEFPVEEHRLALNKLICGIPLDRPLPTSLEFTAEELEESEHLLRTMISRWKIISRSSLAVFRKTFLQKEARLSKEDINWNLHIERGSFDMVLDHLPWPISIARFAWSPTTIYTNW